MIGLQTRTLLVRLSYPDAVWDEAQLAWAVARFPASNIITFVTSGMHVVEARNRLIVEHVLPAPERIDTVVMMDHDMFPCDQTDPCLLREHDVVGARYETGSGHMPWLKTDAVHAGFLKIRRRVLHLMPSPWFWIDYSADGTRALHCECSYFCRKARAMGFSIARSGFCEHRPSRSWSQGA